MRLSRISLWLLIIILLITNIATLLWSNVAGEDKYEEVFKEVDAKGILATIEGTEIKEKQLMQYMAERYGKEALEDLINKEVVYQLAKRNNLVVSDKIIDRELARMLVASPKLTDEEKEKQIKLWKEDIIYRYYLQQLLVSDAEVESTDLESYYDTYKNQYNFEEMIQLSHIVVTTEAEAEEVMTKLDNGERFSDLAELYSIDESKNRDGYIGFYSQTSSFIPGEYFDLAMDMEVGSYSEPILTSQGYAIIYMHEHLDAIDFTLEEAYEEVAMDLKLEQLPISLDATSLWDELEVETIFSKE
ncbi:peptidylprolyl isomerase [Gracilibacillus marinus]|uniref:peptidylprolyl isomerase n=1 Tax=Gracilibacillus marinus TaxID=630535 RepID=A0ABV8VXT5_9BACI